MRWLSKLIKSGNVVLDSPMDLVSILCSAAVSGVTEAAKPENGNGNVSEENSKQSSREDSKADRIHILKYRAREAYETARKQGGIEGYADGLRRGRLEGERRKEEAARNAAESIEKLKYKTESEYRQASIEVSRETLEFAVAIAARVLNDPLEEHQSRYSDLIGQITANAQPGTVLPVRRDADDPVQPAEGQPISQIAVQTQADDPITLEEILQLAAKDRIKLLENIDMRDAVASLKFADETTIQTLLAHLSDRMQDAIREEISLSGPLLAEDAVKARIRIGKVFRRLRANGDI